MFDAFTSGFCGCAGAIVAVVVAATIWILLKMLFGIKDKAAQADINSRSLDALLERNEMTAHTNLRLSQIVDSLEVIADAFALGESSIHINGETGSDAE